MAAKYVYLTRIVPVVETEKFTAILRGLKSIDQYDRQSTLSKSGIVLFEN